MMTNSNNPTTPFEMTKPVRIVCSNTVRPAKKTATKKPEVFHGGIDEVRVVQHDAQWRLEIDYADGYKIRQMWRYLDLALKMAVDAAEMVEKKEEVL